MKVVQSCLTLCNPMDYTVQGILQVRILEWVAHSLLQGIFPTQGSPALQVDSLPAELPGNPNNTEVGCHTLLQGIFPTQGSNPAIPHCRIPGRDHFLIPSKGSKSSNNQPAFPKHLLCERRTKMNTENKNRKPSHICSSPLS